MFDTIKKCKRRFVLFKDGKGLMMRGNTMSTSVSNTMRSREHRCEIYSFNRSTVSSKRRKKKPVSCAGRRTAGRNTRSRSAAKRAAALREQRIRNIRYAALGILIALVIAFAGTVFRAHAGNVPSAYKYYDMVTVGYNENLLDIVQRYDDRDYYNTQMDYVRELCRINNLDYNGKEFPVVTPGTSLFVPYYSEELK